MNHRLASLDGRHAAAIGFMCLAGFGWAVSTAVSRLIPQDMPIQQVVWARYGVHLLILLLFVAPRRRVPLWRTTRPGRQIARGLTMLAMPLLFVIGSSRLSVTDVWAVVWSAPPLALALGALALKEVPPVGQWAAVALAFGGMTIALDPSMHVLRVALVALPLGAALAFAAFQVMTRHLRDQSTATGIFYTAICVVVPLTVVPGVVQRPSAMAVVVAFAMGVSWLLVLVSLDEALKRARLGIVAPFIYTELVWTLVIGRFVFGDPITRRVVAGALLVTAGCTVGAATCLRAAVCGPALANSTAVGSTH